MLADKRTLTQFFLPRNLSWPMMLSVSLHASLIAGLLYASFLEIRPQALFTGGQLQAIMVNPAMFSGASGQAAPPSPIIPRAADAPPSAALPPARKPSAVPPPPTSLPPQRETPQQAIKPAVQTAKSVASVDKSAIKKPPEVATPAIKPPTPTATPVKPVTPNTSDSRPGVPALDAVTPASGAPAAAQSPSAHPPDQRGGAIPTPGGEQPTQGDRPQAISRPEPEYPQRALALHIEGRVRVRFDVDDAGRVGHIRIVSADPKGVFERDVKRAVRHWRYQPGHSAQNVIVTVYFRIDGRTAVE